MLWPGVMVLALIAVSILHYIITNYWIGILPMVFWLPPIHGILTPTHGILTPLSMVYRPPCPWYIDPLSMVFWPPPPLPTICTTAYLERQKCYGSVSYGILNPMVKWLRSQFSSMVYWTPLLKTDLPLYGKLNSNEPNTNVMNKIKLALCNFSCPVDFQSYR
jgi:hypothetical protein